MTATRTVTSAEPAAVPAGIRDLLSGRGLGAGAVQFASQSASRVDTGGWLQGEPLWALVAGERFVLAAAGPRPYLLELPLEILGRAVYNHVTGAVIFPQGQSGSGIPPVRLDPFVARKLLALAAARPPASPRPTTSPGTLSHA